MTTIGITSHGIRGIKHLPVFLRTQDMISIPYFSRPKCTTLVGWGYKNSGLRARRIAEKNNLPYLLLEQGFLACVERSDPPLSLVVDDRGIYYDATRPSRLEAFISKPLSAQETLRGNTLIHLWTSTGISKYNHARDYEEELPESYVLVVDQVRGDVSIPYGTANESTFSRMLEAALDENPESMVLIKSHPDRFLRGRNGYFGKKSLKLSSRIFLISEDYHPVRLIKQAKTVYTVTSQMGFEALLHGTSVRVFGMPFYAGWGLTQDEQSSPGSRQSASRVQLVYGALIAYPRYVHPETGQACEVESIIEYVSEQRRLRLRFPSTVYAQGFSWLKRPTLRKFLSGSKVSFSKRPPERSTVIVWGKACVKGLSSSHTLVRVEDGFLRSVGLGADLVRPVSWVFDREGIYYDSTAPSELETLLRETPFDDALIARARSLRQRIVSAHITKYNSDTGVWEPPEAIKKPIILVPGQVEHDASLRYGKARIETNMDLLRTVRKERPEAYVVYKPHPDVTAGLRRRGCGEEEAGAFCNEVVTNISVGELFSHVDEVHTLTSLTGFEALLREKSVTCYGQPFYSGWGLTTDRVPPQRRGRVLSLDALVAGCLIMYPTYINRVTGRFTSPERTVDELRVWRQKRPSLFYRQALRPLLLWSNTWRKYG